ncbi:PE-PPE domain-containing protein [Hyalangium gracile]|uniref:PE-PPE domain-containing protein n=1 Tax=Hyalangium gracile TaxID=394092 RepID=UPI00295E750C|nr:PE-PPE domain-containing protein [Hyalangium gracile]
MRLNNNHPVHTPQRVLDPKTPSTALAKREGTAARPALKDGFESKALTRNTLAAPKPGAGDVQSQLRQQFGTLAADKQQFHDTLRGVFGEGYDAAKAEQFRQQAQAGDFGWMPPVKYVGADVLGEAHGAYDAESGTVFLNSALQGDPSLAAATYVEEAGHHLDAQLNTVDSQGDEGELFRRVLGGEKLTQAQVAEIRAENDKGTIQVHGKNVEVEFWKPFKAIGKAFNKVVDVVKDAVDTVVDTAKNVVNTVGNAIGNAAQAVGDFVGNVANKVVSGVKGALQFFGLGSQPDRQFDGKLVGADGQTFEPGTPLDQIPGVTPWGNPNPTETVIYVNGISTDLAGQQAEMRHVAEASGARVVGVHNSTEGAGADLIQCVKDKLDKGTNPAVDTLADTVYAELKAGRDVHLMGYSQGALVTSRALKHLANRLRIEDGMSQAQVEQYMSRIKVETFGGAAASYPDGPQYVHYVNDRDIVPLFFGQGNALDPFRDPGRGAVVHHFSEASIFKPGEAHLLNGTYMKHRVPFDQARRGEF